jgi:hypothetical protein
MNAVPLAPRFRHTLSRNYIEYLINFNLTVILTTYGLIQLHTPTIITFSYAASTYSRLNEFRRMVSSGMLRRVALVKSDVSEELALPSSG